MSVAASLASFLKETGCNVLQKVVENATDKAAEQVKVFIEEKTGIPLPENPVDLTTEQVATIKTAVEDNVLELARIALAQEQVAAADTRDARSAQQQREEVYNKLKAEGKDGGWLSAHFVFLYAAGLSSFFCYYLYKVSFYRNELAQENAMYVALILGNIFSLFGTVVGFFFGNAYGRKQEQLLQHRAATAAATTNVSCGS